MTCAKGRQPETEDLVRQCSAERDAANAALRREAAERKRTQERLRAVERERELVLASLSQHVVRVDQDLRIVTANRVAAESVDARPEELIGRHVHEVWPGFSRDRHGCPLSRALQTGEPQEGEATTPDGRAWRIQASPVRDRDARITGAVGVGLDVSARRQAELALRESERRLRTIFETAQDAVFLKDRQLRYTHINPAMERLLGLSVDRIVGHRDAELSAGEVHQHVREIDRRVLEGHSIEDVYSRERDGELRTLHVVKVPMRDSAGRIVGLCGIARDVTEHKRTEDALRESEARLRAIHDHAAIGMALLDTRGAVIQSNGALQGMTGYGEHELAGMTLAHLTPPADLEREIPLFSELLSGQRNSYVLERRIRRKDAGTAWVRATVSVVRDDVTRPRFCVVIAEDITERKASEARREQLESQLRQAQRMDAIGQLAGGVAHDFNNLLTVLGGCAEQIRGLIPDQHPACQPLGMIDRVVRDATGVSRTLLTLSQELPGHARPVEIGSVVGESARLFRRVLPAAIALAVDAAPGRGLWVEADPTQLQQVLLNLVVNAREAMPNGGSLRIAVAGAAQQPAGAPASHGSAGEVHVTVTDSGPGVPPEVRARIFEPFFTTKARGRAAGLGLAVARNIVEGFGGRLELKAAERRGSEFAIVLPQIPAPPETHADPSPPAPEPGRGEAILLVEDNRHVRMVITAALRELGYEVVQAGDTTAMMDACEQHGARLRLLIVDVDLPGGSGLDCLRTLRSREVTTPALIISGSSGVQRANLEDLDVALLQKPFQMSELGNVVADLLGQQGEHEVHP